MAEQLVPGEFLPGGPGFEAFKKKILDDISAAYGLPEGLSFEWEQDPDRPGLPAGVAPMSEIAVWLRRVIESDKAYAEADFEWELVKAKGGYNETITRAEAELAILDAHHPVAFTDRQLGIVDAQVCSVCHGRLDEPEGYDDAVEGDWPYPTVQATYPCDTVRLLASGYRNRAGWEDEWAAPR